MLAVANAGRGPRVDAATMLELAAAPNHSLRLEQEQSRAAWPLDHDTTKPNCETKDKRNQKTWLIYYLYKYQVAILDIVHTLKNELYYMKKDDDGWSDDRMMEPILQ